MLLVYRAEENLSVNLAEEHFSIFWRVCYNRIILSDEEKKVLFFVEAMGGGVFTYITNLANRLSEDFVFM